MSKLVIKLFLSYVFLISESCISSSPFLGKRCEGVISWVFEKGGREETLIPLPNMLISHIRVGVCVCKHETNDPEKNPWLSARGKVNMFLVANSFKRQNDLFFSHTHVPFIFRRNSLVKKNAFGSLHFSHTRF